MKYSYRPNYAKKDANHTDLFHDLAQMVGGWEHVQDFNGQHYAAYTGAVQGVPFLIIDTSQAGGLCLDTRLYVGKIVLDVEIKQRGKRDELTDGEALYFRLSSPTGRIVTNAEEYYQVILDCI